MRKDFWRISLATDVVQASTTCLAITTQWPKGLQETPTKSGIKELGHHQNHKMTSTGLVILCFHAGVYAFERVWSESVTLVCVWILSKKYEREWNLSKSGNLGKWGIRKFEEHFVGGSNNENMKTQDTLWELSILFKFVVSFLYLLLILLKH